MGFTYVYLYSNTNLRYTIVRYVCNTYMMYTWHTYNKGFFTRIYYKYSTHLKNDNSTTGDIDKKDINHSFTRHQLHKIHKIVQITNSKAFLGAIGPSVGSVIEH